MAEKWQKNLPLRLRPGVALQKKEKGALRVNPEQGPVFRLRKKRRRVDFSP